MIYKNERLSFSRRTILRALGTLTGLESLPTLVNAESDETDSVKEVWRTVTEAYSGESGRGFVRADPDTLAALGVRAGEVVAVGQTRGGEGIPARIWRSDSSEWGQGKVRVGRYIQRAAGTYPGGDVVLRPVDPEPAKRVVLAKPPGDVRIEGRQISRGTLEGMIHQATFRRPVVRGATLPVPLSGGNTDCLMCYVWATEPDGHLWITEDTDISFGGWED